MAQLTTNAVKSIKEGERYGYPVLTAVAIFEGSAVGLQAASGYARQLVAATDLDRFLGFAQAPADNTAGASGAIHVEVLSRGRVPLAVTGVDGVNDIGKAVYASDGNTFTLTQADDTVFVGYVVEHISGTSCWVAFDAAQHPHLTAIADITPAADGTTAGTAVNSILAVLRKAGIITANT